MKKIGYTVALVIVIGLLYLLIKSNSGTQSSVSTKAPEVNGGESNSMNQNSNSSQLKIEDLVVGKGEEALSGKSVTVNYKGTLLDGTKFDSSYDRGVPFTFNLGASEVIQGWDEGVAGMKVGGKRKLTIPASLGYGSRAIGSIPANSTLVFEVELLGVK